MFKPSALKRAAFFILFDIIFSFITLLLAYNLRFNFALEKEFMENFYTIFSIVVIFKIVFISFFKLYQISWRFFSLNETKKLLYAHLLTYGLFTVIYYLFPQAFNPFPRSVIIIDFSLSMIFLGALRASKRLILEGDNSKDLKRTLLIGVNSFAQSLMKEQNGYYVTSVVDDNSEFAGTYFFNIKVETIDSLEKLIMENKIESVIITKELQKDTLQSIYKILSDNNIKDIKIASLNQKENKLKALSVEDLLARQPKDLDKEAIKEFIKDKTVLITGAGGSIGSEISIQCAKYGAKKLILLDHSEYNLYTIEEKLSSYEPSLVMQSVVNLEQLDSTFEKYKPHIVIHAAAYKHVPLCEENINEAILNNVMGTKNTIDCSIKHKVKKFVLISTDKAVRPTNVMGATKRICELYAQNVISKDTEIVAVRFGNVLGSSGSVIPKFKAQIEQGGPITVTHRDITRYFMLIPEASLLVLQASSLGKGGEIFILDMGEPVKIVDLALKMCELSDAKDIDIEFTGLRKGEKLYEELLIDQSDMKTKYESITVTGKTKYNISKLDDDIKELINSSNKIEKLKQIVPEFDHQIN
ncbi:MAG: nucleoside-diphosphate sugar epimerase/dehydratase [Campylobacterota bacterium]|nr:nucleoside-diphosphate sugar epimerase/dehydratase [Campylobacterota bacterium]